MTEKQDTIYKMMVFFFGYLTAGHSSLRAPQSRKTKTWARWFPSSLFPGCGAGLRAQAEPSRLGDLRRWSWETSERVRGMKRKHLPLNWEGTKQARELAWTSPACKSMSLWRACLRSGGLLSSKNSEGGDEQECSHCMQESREAWTSS